MKNEIRAPGCKLAAMMHDMDGRATFGVMQQYMSHRKTYFSQTHVQQHLCSSHERQMVHWMMPVNKSHQGIRHAQVQAHDASDKRNAVAMLLQDGNILLAVWKTPVIDNAAQVAKDRHGKPTKEAIGPSAW